DCKHIELDEMWSFVRKKQRMVTEADDDARVGDQWIYVAICADSKLIPTYLVGKRSPHNTTAFVADLARRLRGRVQISTDGMNQYSEAIDLAFGGEVDYAQITRPYDEAKPTHVVTKVPIFGDPIADRVSTSYVERSNLTIR